MASVDKIAAKRVASLFSCEHTHEIFEKDPTTIVQGYETWGMVACETLPARPGVAKEGARKRKLVPQMNLPVILSKASQQNVAFFVEALKALNERIHSGIAGHAADRVETQNPTFQGIMTFLRGLDSHLRSIEKKLEALQASQRSLVVAVTTFTPEPYDLVRPLQVVVRPAEEGFCASFYDANLHATGDTEEEAIGHLKSLILDTFDSLTSEEPNNLGPEPRRQLAVLKYFLLARS